MKIDGKRRNRTEIHEIIKLNYNFCLCNATMMTAMESERASLNSNSFLRSFLSEKFRERKMKKETVF